MAVMGRKFRGDWKFNKFGQRKSKVFRKNGQRRGKRIIKMRRF